MKTLPDSPDLGHLRQQAKDLLPQLRSVQPGAALSDAQALVAENYGFRTWPDLKAEVDRRNAAVRPADDGLTAAIAAAFGLGPPTGPMTPLERQWAGQAWTLTTERGRWLARRLWDGSKEAAIELEVVMAEAAAEAGIRTMRPVRSPAGNVVESVDGRRWRVYALEPMGPEPSIPADPRHAAAAGRILGRVHRLAVPAAPPVSPWLTCARPEERWWALQAMAEERDRPWAGPLADAIPAIVQLTPIVSHADPADPIVLSGCHYAPNAFRVAGPDDLVVVTWEHAGAMVPRWDLGGMLDAWSGGAPGRIHRPAVHAVVAGYAEEAELPPLDITMFSAAVCATLNWLGSRIRIALTEPDDEARDVADRSVPWLVAHLPSPAHYEALLAAAREIPVTTVLPPPALRSRATGSPSSQSTDPPGNRSRPPSR